MTKVTLGGKRVATIVKRGEQASVIRWDDTGTEQAVPNYHMMMLEDGLPDNCLIPKDKRDEAWEKNPPKAMPLFETKPTARTAADEAAMQIVAEAEAARKRTQSLKQISKMKNRIASKQTSADNKAAIRQGKRWDPRTSSWIDDKPGSAKPVPIVMSVSAVKRAREGSVTKTDDLAQRLAGMTAPELIQLAKDNGIHKVEYDSLPNPGLLRMTVGNRLRNLVKKGVKIK